MPETGFGEPRALERAVMSYYEGHATEENRTCLSPYMHGLTRSRWSRNSRIAS